MTQTLDNIISEQLKEDAVSLLKQLISTPSLSKEEDGTANMIESFFAKRDIQSFRHLNNVWCFNKYSDPSKPNILLNSHHDTVKPDPAYTRDPYKAEIEDGKLFGLGSNDAGASLVSLIACFLHFYEKDDLPFNLVIAATAEEEISGINGIESIIPLLPEFYLAIVGEPTKTDLAISEKGLIVLDCIAQGQAGHAAREEGENAIYNALRDIEWFRDFKFEKESQLLGPVKMSVTSIQTINKAHNVVPSTCSFVVDVRVNDQYTLEEILETVKQNIKSSTEPRSMRIRPSSISIDHSIVKAGLKLGKKLYGSPTTSDQALIPYPSVKCGPGDRARSHTADEFVYLDEIKEGIETYINLLLKQQVKPNKF